MPTVTLDPAYNTANITLSNGNLTLTSRVANSWFPSRATVSFGTGKIYFEVTCNTSNAGATQVGVVNASATPSNYIGDANGLGYQSGGNVVYNGSALSNIGTWTTGDTICVAYDLGNKKVWFRKNGGNWNNTTDNPATNTGGFSAAGVFGGTVYPAACAYSSGDQLTVNFGATAFAQAVPAGFNSPNATALIWTDTFDTYTAGSAPPSPWYGVSNSPISTAQAHSASNSLPAGTSGNNSDAQRPIGANLHQWYADFWMWTNSTGTTTNQHITFNVGTTTATGTAVNVTQTGSGIVGLTGSAGWFSFTVSLSTWHHYLLEVTTDAAGSAKLTVDGTVVGTYSGDTRDFASNTYVNNVWVHGGTIGPSPPAEFYIDDLSIYSGGLSPPALDGTATGQATGGTTVSATLTTTSANDIICALVAIEKASTALWLTGVSGGSLTWNKRTQATLLPPLGGNPLSTELWWAVAPTALSAVTITATANAAIDDAAILVFGVSGCNTTNPWDANVSLAARQIATSPLSFSGISTTRANDFLIFGWGSNGGNAIGTVPTGFTVIGNRNNGGGSLFASVGAAYQAVTSVQSNQAYAWGSSLSGVSYGIFDALTAELGGSTVAPRPTWETISVYFANSVSSGSLTIGGPSANDVIVVMSYAEQSGGGPAITGISGGGLTWLPRSRSHSSARGSLEIWYAKASGALAASTITITYAATADCISVAALAVTGCDGSVWDAHSPAIQSNTAGGTWTPSATVTTAQAHDLMLALTGLTNNPSMTSVPSGYTFLTSNTSNAGITYGPLAVSVQSRNTTQSGATVAWSSSLADMAGANAGGEYIVDALTADAPNPYTAWNPSDKNTGVTLSNSNLTATNNNNVQVQGVRAVDGQLTGKFYWECTYNTTANVTDAVGVCRGSTALNTQMNSSSGTGASSGYVAVAPYTSGQIYYNGTTFGQIGSIVAGSVVGIALDLTNHLIWFRLGAAGNWNGSGTANPATGVGGISIPDISVGVFPAYPLAQVASTGDAITANFGGSVFTGTVPSGFTSGFLVSAGSTSVVLTQALVEEWGAGTPSVQLTQAFVEEWGAPSPQAQLTQIAAEHWFRTSPAVQLTQIAIEQWASLPPFVPSAPHRYWGIRATKDNGFYSTDITSGLGFYTGNSPSSYTLALADVTMATSVGGTNLCTNTANAYATTYANPSNAPSKALVGQSPDKWTSDQVTSGEHLPIWWYDFGSAVSIVELSFNNRGGFPPPAFSLVASDDAVTWYVVQPFGVPAAWSGSVSQTFDVTALSGANHYLWGLLVDNGLFNFKQMSDVAFAASAGGANISNNPFLAGSNNTANSSNLPSMAADSNLTGTQWSSAAAGGAFRWFYAFTTPQNPAEVRVTVGNTTYAPTSILVQYSDDAVNWTTARAFTPAAWTVGTAQAISLAGAAVQPVRAMILA